MQMRLEKPRVLGFPGNLNFQFGHLAGLLDILANNVGDPGSRAVEALRMEKSYPAFWRDLTAKDTLVEAGLCRFIDAHKPDFVGRGPLLKQLNDGVSRRLVVLRMASGEANPYQNETVYRHAKPVGRITPCAPDGRHRSAVPTKAPITLSPLLLPCLYECGDNLIWRDARGRVAPLLPLRSAANATGKLSLRPHHKRCAER